MLQWDKFRIKGWSTLRNIPGRGLISPAVASSLIIIAIQISDAVFADGCRVSARSLISNRSSYLCCRRQGLTVRSSSRQSVTCESDYSKHNMTASVGFQSAAVLHSLKMLISEYVSWSFRMKYLINSALFKICKAFGILLLNNFALIHK